MIAVAEIPVDLLNPGQVFACLGLVEAADVLVGDARGAFDWRDPGKACFRVHADAERNPVEIIVAFLQSATVTALRPMNASFDWLASWGPLDELPEDAPFPIPLPSSGATLPARIAGIVDDGRARRSASLICDAWGDDVRATGRDPFKLWGGSRGYPGAALARDAIALLREAFDPAVDPFAVQAPQSSSFRLDWRRDYVPLDAGFSPNEHGALTMVGYPFVELLAAVGLTHARPEYENRLSYRYGVTAGPPDGLAPMYLRAALSGAALPFPQRRFRMKLDWPAQEGQARCITTVSEET